MHICKQWLLYGTGDKLVTVLESFNTLILAFHAYKEIKFILSSRIQHYTLT